MESNTYKYCCDSTAAHSIVNFYPCSLKQIAEIIDKEIINTPKLSVIKDIFENTTHLALDMESVEECYNNPNGRDQRVDLSFVVKNVSNKKVVLIELKLNVANPINVAPIDIKNKILGSSKHFTTDELFENYFLIFADNKISQARSVLNRRCGVNLLPRTCLVATLTELHSLFFTE